MIFNTQYKRKKCAPVKFNPQSRTKQQFKDECDINTILKKYQDTGMITHIREGGTFGDFSQVGSYQEAMEVIVEAQQSFMELPSEVRERFGNDPGLFLNFMQDPKNQDEMIKLGLATRREEKPSIQLSKNKEVKNDPPKDDDKPKD